MQFLKYMLDRVMEPSQYIMRKMVKVKFVIFIICESWTRLPLARPTKHSPIINANKRHAVVFNLTTH
jgi:hypothetical protein